MDWGSVINSLVVCQSTSEEFRALKSMYVLGEDKKMQDDLADDFCAYYAAHTNKVCYLLRPHGQRGHRQHAHDQGCNSSPSAYSRRAGVCNP